MICRGGAVNLTLVENNREEKQYGPESTVTECGRCDLPGGGWGHAPVKFKKSKCSEMQSGCLNLRNVRIPC